MPRTHSALIAAGIAAAGLLATAAPIYAKPLIKEPLPLAGALEILVETDDIAPASAAHRTTASVRGHTHPSANYVYVLAGRVISRVGSGSERTYVTGETWVEHPGDAHFLVNASTSEPARLLVTFIYPAGTTRLSTPLP